MRNPFTVASETEKEDRTLVIEALAGKRRSLEELVKRHQGWIFNIAVRMTADFDKAEDVTQEILIKIITRLDSYDSEKGAFRTWLYRIVANDVISLKRKEKRYIIAGGFKAFGERIDSVPMEDLPDEGSLSQESKLLVEESKNGCMTGMLLCFSPRQRLVYILGEIFNVSGREGAEIVGVSPGNFRKILSRARTELYEFMNEKCGLINKRARCRCAKKVMPHIKTGRIRPDNLKFSRKGGERIQDLAEQKVQVLNRLAGADLQQLHQQQPFYTPDDSASLFKSLLDHPKYSDLFS